MTDKKYIIELEFSEVEMLKNWLEKMHHDERAAHALSEFLKERITDAETDANLARSRELNEEARLLLEQAKS